MNARLNIEISSTDYILLCQKSDLNSNNFISEVIVVSNDDSSLRCKNFWEENLPLGISLDYTFVTRFDLQTSLEMSAKKWC